MPTRTRELTLVFLYQPEDEEYDEDADLVSVLPKGVESGENRCDYCEGNEDAPAVGALCDAHAVEESIKDVGALFWLERELEGPVKRGPHWRALKEAKTDKKVTIVGRNCWTAINGPDGFDQDEEFEVSSVTIEDEP